MVDDGSADGTAEIADELARTYPEVRAVHHPRNRDYGAALRTGFRSATKELIFYTDGDAQYDPAELSVLWNALTADADLVNGYKISRSDPFHRIVIGRIYHHAVSSLFGLNLRDVDCDFRLMRRIIFDRINLEKTSGVICVEMMKKIQDSGFRDRRSAGAPLPSRVRTVAVLQLPPAVPGGEGSARALAGAGRATRASQAGADSAGADGGRSRQPRLPRTSATVTGDYLSFYKGRRVVITGGLGFIGSNLARRLVDLGADVLLVDSLIPDFGGNLFNIDGIADRLQINVADVRQQSTMNYLVQGVRGDLQPRRPGEPHRQHARAVRGSRDQLPQPADHPRSVPAQQPASESRVRRNASGLRPARLAAGDEAHLVRPTDVNGINKAAGEYYHLVYNNVFGVRACSLRLTNVYGPRQLIKHNRQGSSDGSSVSPSKIRRFRSTATARRFAISSTLTMRWTRSCGRAPTMPATAKCSTSAAIVPSAIAT